MKTLLQLKCYRRRKGNKAAAVLLQRWKSLVVMLLYEHKDGGTLWSGFLQHPDEAEQWPGSITGNDYANHSLLEGDCDSPTQC